MIQKVAKGISSPTRGSLGGKSMVNEEIIVGMGKYLFI
jgi:hypothetical protein